MKVKLGDVCSKASSGVAQKDLENNIGSYPIYGASGFIKNVDFYQQDKPYIAVVKDGAGVGRVMKLPAKSSVIGTMQYIIPHKDVNVSYLAYALEHMNLSKYYLGAAIPHILLMCDKEAIEVQKILPFLSDTWPLCRIGRAVIRASQSCRQSCNKSQCPACGCRSHHSCTHAPQFSRSFPAREWGSVLQRQGACGQCP